MGLFRIRACKRKVQHGWLQSWQHWSLLLGLCAVPQPPNTANWTFFFFFFSFLVPSPPPPLPQLACSAFPISVSTSYWSCFHLLPELPGCGVQQPWKATPLGKGRGGEWMLENKPGNIPWRKTDIYIYICTVSFCFNWRNFFFFQNAKYFVGRKLTFPS